MNGTLLTDARQRAGLSVTELARRAGTSRPTLSAYEHGRVSPTLDTVERILSAAGQSLRLVRRPRWREAPVGRGRITHLPDLLPRLRAYEAILREGRRRDVERYIDGALLVEAWDDLVLPRDVRAAWQSVIDEARGQG